MHNIGTLKKLLAGGLLSAGLAVGMFATAGAPAAQADAWPGCPNDHPAGPCHWCPGDPPVQTGNLRVNSALIARGAAGNLLEPFSTSSEELIFPFGHRDRANPAAAGRLSTGHLFGQHG